MNERIIETVSGNPGGFVVRIAVSKARSIIIHPGYDAPELMHLPDKVVIGNIGHAIVHTSRETGDAILRGNKTEWG